MADPGDVAGSKAPRSGHIDRKAERTAEDNLSPAEEHFVCVEAAVEGEDDVPEATCIVVGTVVVVVTVNVVAVADETSVHPLRD